LADKDLVVFQMGFAPEEEYIQKKYGDGWKRRAMGLPGEGGWGVEGDTPNLPEQAGAGADQTGGAGTEGADVPAEDGAPVRAAAG